MKKQLIFIDDDELLIEIAKIILNSLEVLREIPTLFFRSGDHFLSEHNFKEDTHKNILFLDLNMPGLDGWQVVDKLVESGNIKNYTIYMLSSSIHPMDKEKADNNPNIAGYIEKPLSKSKVLEATDLKNG
ncbi:response regulator [Flammeovirga agarivorans]|uniref:Response regulator n=1 Tax=Flammeovirga agarivorans TaxID=2726742 RepID=A0A7X8SHN4_9BACT|nr:response regulator [Flammeovirga agarivorans]NLR90400.1 response regulator [Flammeovirga agarivorans]